jgi:long-chain acyl-CoA synthetase
MDFTTVKAIILVEGEGLDVAGTISYQDLVSSQPADPPDIDAGGDCLAAILYSSGTTGLPKGVMMTQRSLVYNHYQHALATGIGENDSYIVYTPLSHIFGMALMGLAVYAGARQILLERFDLDRVIQLIEEHGVTWLFAVPPVLLALANAADLARKQLSSVKFALSGAAPLAPEIARGIKDRFGVQVIQGYGSTEAGATHYSPLETSRIRQESCGVPMADTEHRVVDSETGERELAAGEIGEIVVRGPQIMQGYWNAPEETSAVLRNGWLHTGDIGWIDGDGYLFVVDRKKELIKYKSFSVSPVELEGVILEHPDVADCGVVGIPDPEAGEIPKAFVVPAAGKRIDLAELASFVAERVAGYKQVRRFEIADRIPRTPTGKILRRMLKQ